MALARSIRPPEEDCPALTLTEDPLTVPSCARAPVLTVTSAGAVKSARPKLASLVPVLAPASPVTLPPAWMNTVDPPATVVAEPSRTLPPTSSRNPLAMFMACAVKSPPTPTVLSKIVLKTLAETVPSAIDVLFGWPTLTAPDPASSTVSRANWIMPLVVLRLIGLVDAALPRLVRSVSAPALLPGTVLPRPMILPPLAVTLMPATEVWRTAASAVPSVTPAPLTV